MIYSQPPLCSVVLTSDDYSLLMEASRIGNVESARKLLDRGANPNLTNSVSKYTYIGIANLLDYNLFAIIVIQVVFKVGWELLCL